jgi:hypothetical protein
MTDGRRRPRTDEEKNKISETTKAAMAKPEIRAKLSAALMGRYAPNTGKSPGNQLREKISKGLLRYFAQKRGSEKISIRDDRLRSMYGIGESEYSELFKKQGGVCAACGRSPKNGRVLVIDHDHATGRVRGLLCNNCNVAIGLLSDSAEIMRKVIRYLER